MSLTNDEITAKNFKEFYRKILPYLVRGNNGYSETPIGAMQMFDDNAAPSGWLIADGTVYNISDYPFLAKHFERVHGSKNYYGGDGTTTFAVPNWQGEFFRASGTNSHTNQGNGGAVGEHQDATVFSNLFNNLSGTTTVIQLNVGDANAPAPNDMQLTRDYTYDRSNFYQTVANTGGTAMKNVGPYTSRPTNTSLLCCIKAVPAGVNYSTEEQEIGTWIDGKPLYQKTITISSDSYDLSSLNIEHIHLANMVTNDTGSVRLFDSGYYSETDFFRLVYANNTLLKQKGASGTMPEVIATIQYTKTTD